MELQSGSGWQVHVCLVLTLGFHKSWEILRFSRLFHEVMCFVSHDFLIILLM
jgi:hypothetical protein